jgi:hypothetical protein
MKAAPATRADAFSPARVTCSGSRAACHLATLATLAKRTKSCAFLSLLLALLQHLLPAIAPRGFFRFAQTLPLVVLSKSMTNVVVQHPLRICHRYPMTRACAHVRIRVLEIPAAIILCLASMPVKSVTTVLKPGDASALALGMAMAKMDQAFPVLFFRDHQELEWVIFVCLRVQCGNLLAFYV